MWNLVLGCRRFDDGVPTVTERLKRACPRRRRGTTHLPELRNLLPGFQLRSCLSALDDAPILLGVDVGRGVFRHLLYLSKDKK